MEEFSCLHCELSSTNFGDIIHHNLEIHEEKNLKIKISKFDPQRKETISYKKDFKITPKDLKLSNRTLLPNDETKTVKVSRLVHMSPIKKAPKPKTPVKDVHKFLEESEDIGISDEDDTIPLAFENMTLLESTSSTQTDPCFVLSADSCNEADINTIENIIQQIPNGLDYLKSENQMEMYIKFTTLLAERKIPLSNIAFLLFAHVVEWFSVDTTRNMRYSEEVKTFWRIGLKLFKGRFLRFMSGWKNQGQELKGDIRPADSVINFAVPSLSCLQESNLAEKLKQSRPGMFEDMIELIKKDDVSLRKTFKLCVDGKKINIGKQHKCYGDIDLWGNEGHPTVNEKMEKLDDDIQLLEELSSILEKAMERDVYELTDLNDEVQNALIILGKKILNILSSRLEELRLVKQKKTVTLEKIKSLCTSEVLRQKYSYALSAIRTHVFQINVCIGRLLKSIDVVASMIAFCNGVGHLYVTGNSCDLSITENYICLCGPKDIANYSENDVNTSLVKQRSEPWQNIRKMAKVTGSTCHTAIGLSGLKKQKEHFEHVLGDKDEQQVSEELEIRFRHGTENEINAVATLVSKVLPVYDSDAVYVEEGCEVIKKDKNTLMVVSPDGSVRKQRQGNFEMYSAVEIKCPYPGKVYKTPVYYEIPWYYVSQVILEMRALNVQELYFLSYTDESTTVFKVYFDVDLWEDIYKRVINVSELTDINTLKKLPPDIQELKDKIKRFCKEKVCFIGEFPWAKATRICDHPGTSSNSEDVGHHRQSDVTKAGTRKYNCPISQILTVIHELTDTVSEAHDISRQLASEVLVFLISDLNRIHRQ